MDNINNNVVGWYLLGSAGVLNSVAISTKNKPNPVKRFFMRTLLDFYWVSDEYYNNERQIKSI